MIVNSATRANIQPDSAQTPASPQAGLSDQFMKLLLAQLRNQNPLEPMNNSEFMGQMTQLNSLQELTKINDNLVQLVQIVEAQAVAQAAQAAQVAPTTHSDAPAAQVAPTTPRVDAA